MNNIKMSEYFSLPVKCDQWGSISDHRGVILTAQFDSIDGAVVEAINSHDRLVEENKNLFDNHKRVVNLLN